MSTASPLPLTTLFAKRPLAGRVKTRLVPPLEPSQAALLAQAMLDDLVAAHLRWGRRHAAGGPGGSGGPGSLGAYETALAVSPAVSRAWFARRYPGVSHIEPQGGEDLGQRLADWFERHLAPPSPTLPPPSVVVVGADCPLLAPVVVARAHGRLAAGVDLVLAPDTGGGYALVGLPRPAPELFLGVPMSHPDNLHRTLDRAAKLGLSVELLGEERDVDDERDLLALARELRTRVEAGRVDEDFPERTLVVLEELLPAPRA